jgi:omega-6 fatty acid desaturase (delta-12 desaturase)
LYLQYLVTQCHVYDEDVNYVPFDFAKEEAFFAAQRKFLPN